MPTTDMMLDLGRDLGRQHDVQLAVISGEILVADANNQPTPLVRYLGSLCSFNSEPYVVPKPEDMAVLTLALGWSAAARQETNTLLVDESAEGVQ